MKWSYSASRSFKQCQRQWYYKNIIANGRAKADPVRKQAYLLSKLQSVSAWRGKIVDDIISKMIVPCLNRKAQITLKMAKLRARELFDNQLAFAKSHSALDLDLQPSKHGDSFALLYAVQYDGGVRDGETEAAWHEIESALGNLFALGAIKDLLKSSDYVVAQRALTFAVMDGITTLAYPDAIAFRHQEPPVILDWKVHVFGQNDAWLQLAIYAIALSRCGAHKDFPEGFKVEPSSVKLYEAQLLTNAVREHCLDGEQIEEAEEYLISSAYEIACLTEGGGYSDLNVEDFRPALHAEICQRCAFRAICWEGQHVH
ncbi:MAG TPA: PD-(D/E)XK nuclease family protein [Steroidobacteraceae bacterium]|nr:PD-(D/E)XK nuclease family protein [Steroidobacteraceae bacterium]